MNEYFSYIREGKLDEAEKVRKASVPDKLIKYVSLAENKDDNKKKFDTLENKSLWFSNIRKVNDPYEFQGIILDEQQLREKGYTQEDIEYYKSMLDFKDYGIACFSSNQPDFLPMWAYYTNNHKGFCVEYDVIKKDIIHEVMYEPKRIKIASFIFQIIDAYKRAMKTGDKNEIKKYLKMLMQELYIKSDSWSHEKEWRIVYQIGDEDGKNIPLNNIGLRTNRIIAGINCSKENLTELNRISNVLGLGNVYNSELDSVGYTINIFR